MEAVTESAKKIKLRPQKAEQPETYDIADKIRQSLVERGISVVELSKEIGISPPTASRFLRGLAGLGQEPLGKICHRYGYVLSPVTPISATAAIPEGERVQPGYTSHLRGEINDQIIQAIRDGLEKSLIHVAIPVTMPSGSTQQITISVQGRTLVRDLLEMPQ